MSDSSTPPKPRRSRRIRLLVGSMIGAFGALAFGYLFLTSQMFLVPQVKKQVSKQLGAKLELGSLSVSLISGIRLENVQLFLPTESKGRGYAEGGSVEDKSSLSFASFDFSWRVLALAKGCLCVDAVQFRHLEARVDPTTTGSNWDAIGVYRKAHPEMFPPDLVEPKPEAPSEPLTWKRLSGWLNLIPFLLQVRIENVGLKDSFVQLLQPGQKQVSRLAMNVDLWFRFLQKSRLETGVRAGLTGLRQGQSELPPLDLGVAINGVLDASSRSVSLEELSVRLNDILANELSGRMSVVDEDTVAISKIKYSIAEMLKVNLTAASPVVAAFLPHLHLKGEAVVENFNADGTLDLDSPASMGVTVNGQPHPFPTLLASLRLTNIAVQSDEWGVNLNPLSFSSSLHAAPSGDEQVDVTALWQGASSGASYDQKPIHLAIDGLTTSGEIKARWPAQTLPEAKLALEVQKLQIKAVGLGKLAVPVRIQLNASGDGKSQKGAARLVADIGTLASLNAGVEVGEKIGKVDGTWQLSLPSLPALMAIAKQLDAVAKMTTLPDLSSGKLLFAGRVAASLPPGGKLDSANPLSGVDGQIDTKMSLEKVSAKLDAQKISIKESALAIGLSGPLRKLKLSAKMRFDEIGVGGEGETSKGVSIAAKGGTIDLDIPTQIDGTIDLSTLLTQLSVTPTLAVRVASLALPQALPAPLEKLELDIQSELRRAQVFAFKKFRLFWPGIGATVTAQADGALDQWMKPTGFTATANLHLADAERKDVQPGITTSGGLDLAVKAKSQNMKEIFVDGALRLLNLSVRIANKDKTGETFAAEKIRGTLPFSQIVTLGADAPLPAPPPLIAAVKPKQPASDPAPAEEEEQVPQIDEAAIAQENEHKEEEELNDAVKGFLDSRKNPFKEQRSLLTAVSYADVRPFMEGRNPIVIDRIVAAGFELGRSELDLSVSQNWLSANEFLISFLGGKIQGSLQFAFDHRPVALRSSIHLTRLNTHRLVEGIPGLKEKARSWVLISDPFIDSTIHLNYDFLTSDMSGGVEITSIGQEQLKMLLYFIDPDSQNPTITDIKRALNVGEVRQVSVPIKNGQIGLSVDVRLLKAPIPTPKLQRFPIAQLVDNFKSRSTAAAPAKAR